MGKSNYLLIAFAFMLVLMIGLGSAEATLPPIQQGTCMPLIQYCANCTYVNFTSMTYPNGSVQTLNWVGGLQGTDTYVNNSFCSTQQLGTYVYGTTGNPDSIKVSQSVAREVTGNGRSGADGSVIIVFVIAFIVIMGFLVYQLIMSIGHFLNLDFDVMDLSKSWGLYFALLALYETELFYLGSVDIGNWLLLFIWIGGFTHLLVPLIAFIISITVGSLKKKEFDVGMKHFKRTKL